jgi:hypothetical protein
VFRDCEAGYAVLEEAAVAVLMPKNPANAKQNPAVMNANRTNLFWIFTAKFTPLS